MENENEFFIFFFQTQDFNNIDWFKLVSEIQMDMTLFSSYQTKMGDVIVTN